MSRLIRLLSFGCLLAGCSVTELRERDRNIAVNECSPDRGCPEGQGCSPLGCIAPMGTLSSLLFEVTPGLSSDTTRTAQFFKQFEKVPLVPTADLLGNGSVSLDLPSVVSVSGSLNAAGCELTFSDPGGVPLAPSIDGSIPARLTFVPSQQLWGLATSSASTTTVGNSGSYSFQVSLPGGAYDVYVEPFSAAESPPGQAKSCTAVPQLFREQDLTRSSSLKLALATPKHIELKFRFADTDQNLEGWRVDMVEPVTGRVISNTVELDAPTRGPGTLLYTASMDYVPVWGDDPKLTHGELVRLSPPKQAVAPTLFFWREGLEWASPGEGLVDQLSAFPSPVSFSGSVSAPDGTGVPASVTFTATEISGVPGGLFPSFIRHVETDARGLFRVELLPGKYKAIAAPSVTLEDRPYALSTTALTVPTEPPIQAGATLSVSPALLVQGSAFTSRGEGAWGAIVTAEVSPSRVTTNAFERAIGDLPIVPRAANDTIGDPSGNFQLFTEPGVYDLFVRPPTSSGYAWLVMPGFEPALGATETPDIALPELYLPAPVPVEFDVNWPGNKEPDPLLVAASINAYALLDATGAPTTDARAAVSAVRVAEGRLNEFGRVTLLLPAKVDQPPDGFVSLPPAQ